MLVDFSQVDGQIYDTIKSHVDGLDIGVLVNNAGIGKVGKFLDFNDKFINDILNVNVKAVVKVSINSANHRLFSYIHKKRLFRSFFFRLK